jgi:hypothetical protein
MNFLRDRRVIMGLGAAVALVAGLAIAWVFLVRTPASTAPPPAAGGSLIVVTGRADDQKLDPKRPLRCFVGGQFVGELPLEVCAQRNGVATGALDVGLDPSGALAATNGTGADLTPLPAPEPPLSQPMTEPNGQGVAGDDGDSNDAEAAPPPQSEGGATAACWRYVGADWKSVSQTLTLSGCVQAVFAQRCPPPGQALFARWGEQSLRLQNGQVGISSDSTNFQPLIDAWPACQAHAPALTNAARPPSPHAIGSHP